MTRFRTAVVMASTWLVACGGDEPIELPPVDQPIDVTVVAGAVSMPSATPDVSLPATLSISAVGSLAGLTVVGSDEGAFVVDTELVPLVPFSDGGPADTGPIRLVSRRAESILVVADNGWFHTSGATSELLWSPASDTFVDLDIVDVSALGAGQDEQIWLATAQGLHRILEGSLSQWSVVGEDRAPSAVLATAERVLVAFGGTVYEIDPPQQAVVRVDYDFGTIVDIAPGLGDTLLIATDAGLYRRDTATTYTHFTLADTDTPTGIVSASFDPLEGLYATTDAGLFVMGTDAPIGVAAAPGSVVSVDDFGRVWLATTDALLGFDLGSPLSFAADVAPIVAEKCMQCHGAPGANGAPPVDFTDHATAIATIDDVLARVSAGQMPPPGQGTVSASERELIVRWQTSGLAP